MKRNKRYIGFYCTARSDANIVWVCVQSTFEKLESELKEINSNRDTLKQNFTERLEMNYLLQMADDFFEEVENHLVWYRYS